MSDRKKILLIGDTPGWAFDNIIEFIRKNVEGYDFYYDYTIYNPSKENKVQSDLAANEGTSNLINKYTEELPLQNIPVLRGLVYRNRRKKNRAGLRNRNEEGKKIRTTPENQYDLVVYLDYYMDKDADFSHVQSNKLVRGIYTAGFPPKGISIDRDISINEFCNQYLADVDAVVTGAPVIKSLYDNELKSPVHFANMAYDESIFTKKSDNISSDKLVLGWTGNPKREFKGFNSIVLPVVQELKKEGYEIQLNTQFEGTLESLANFWQGIDIALITSEADAGPSLFMEGSLCGVPSISTKIGMPEYVIEHEKNGLFIERSKEALKEAIIRVYNNRELLDSMAGKIRGAYIEKLGMKVQVENWKRLFESILYK